MFQHSLASDLHLDAHAGVNSLLQLEPWEQNIILAGDFSNGISGAVFARKMKDKGKFVFSVDGNHEHYQNNLTGRSLWENEQAFFELAGQESHVYQLEDDLRIVGWNGWYQIDDPDHWKGYMLDASRVNASADDINDLARQHAETLFSEINGYDGRCIVVTHTAPCEASLDPRFEGSDGNGYFWSPHLEKVLKELAPKIAVWYHGHTHAAMDVNYEGVRVMTNPRGYPGENPRWKIKNLSV